MNGTASSATSFKENNSSYIVIQLINVYECKNFGTVDSILAKPKNARKTFSMRMAVILSALGTTQRKAAKNNNKGIHNHQKTSKK